MGIWKKVEELTLTAGREDADGEEAAGCCWNATEQVPRRRTGQVRAATPAPRPPPPPR